MSPAEEYEDGDINTVDDSVEEFDNDDYQAGDVNTVADGGAEAGDDGANRADGGTPTAVLSYLARSLADEPDAVVVRTDARQGSVRLSLHVAADDMGRVIGRRGRTAQALRTLVGVAGARDGVQTSVDIVDD